MKPRARKSSQIRRKEIADAALSVIGQQGASALTAATIAAEVGLTSGALFRHFPTVEAILEEAVDNSIAAVSGTFPPEDLPPAQRLRAIADARIELMTSRPGLAWLLMSDQVYLTVSEAAVARLRELVARSRAFLASAVRDGIEDGSFRRDITPEAQLVIFSGTLHALVGSGGVHRDRVRRTGVLDALFAMLAPPHNSIDSTPEDQNRLA
jgi:AcrR family transcriptional regulator